MDEERDRRARAPRPIQPLLDAVDGARATCRDLAAFLGELRAASAGSGLFGSYVDTDDRNSDRYLFNLVQGGLGLPDESLLPRGEVRRDPRRSTSPTSTRLLDARRAAPTPPAPPPRVLALETRLAAGPLGARRDPRRPEDLQPDDRSAELRGAAARRSTGTPTSPPSAAPTRRSPRSCVRQPSYLAHLSTRARRDRRSRTGRPGCSCRRAALGRAVPLRRRSSRPTSTSTAAPSTAPPSCGPAGSAASRWSRARSARRSARSTSPGTSRRAPRS